MRVTTTLSSTILALLLIAPGSIPALAQSDLWSNLEPSARLDMAPATDGDDDDDDDAGDGILFVDCNEGGDLAAALRIASLTQGPLTIAVTGTCTGNYTVRRSDLTIRSPSDDDNRFVGALADDGTSAGPVLRIAYAENVTLENLTFVGGDPATVEMSHAGATLRGCTIDGADRGVLMEASDLNLLGATLRNNRLGLVATQSSEVLIDESSILDSTRSAVVPRKSTVSIVRSTIQAPATIPGEPLPWVFFAQDLAYVQIGEGFVGKGNLAILDQSQLEVVGRSEINGRVILSTESYFELYTPQLTLGADSSVELYEGSAGYVYGDLNGALVVSDFSRAVLGAVNIESVTCYHQETTTICQGAMIGMNSNCGLGPACTVAKGAAGPEKDQVDRLQLPAELRRKPSGVAPRR